MYPIFKKISQLRKTSKYLKNYMQTNFTIYLTSFKSQKKTTNFSDLKKCCFFKTTLQKYQFFVHFETHKLYQLLIRSDI